MTRTRSVSPTLTPFPSTSTTFPSPRPLLDLDADMGERLENFDAKFERGEMPGWAREQVRFILLLLLLLILLLILLLLLLLLLLNDLPFLILLLPDRRDGPLRRPPGPLRLLWPRGAGQPGAGQAQVWPGGSGAQVWGHSPGKHSVHTLHQFSPLNAIST